jgi:hypothetical protein
VPNVIPPHRREQVRKREMGRCLRCGGPGANWHHRRSRSVRDEHTHCACNGVWLCGSGTEGCHGWAHSHPFEAKAAGLIVSRYEATPGGVTVVSFFGPIRLGCDGRFTYDSEWSQVQ